MLRRVGVHGPFIPSVRQPTAAAANEPKPKYPRPNQQDSDDDDDDDDADEDDATNENAQHASQDNVVDEREALFNSATDESELMSSVITTPETQIALVVSPVKTTGSLAISNTKKPTSDAVKVLPKPLVANSISSSLPSTTKRPAVVAKKVPVVPIQPPTQTQNNAPKVRTTKPLTKPLLNSVPTPSPTDSISTEATEPALSKKKPSTKVAGKKAAPKPTRPKDSVPPSPEKEERITMASYIRMQGGTPMKSAEEKKTTKDKTTDHAATTRRVAPVMPSVQHVTSNPTYAPQLRVVDGKIVIDEQSLVVSTGPEQIEYEEGIVHESGLNITSASFTSRPSAERWTNTETERFYEGLRYWGTDFNLISKLFTNRNRRQIRNKYKREERYNLSKLNEALENRKKADEETIKLVSQRIASSQPPTTIINTITTTVEDDQSETSEGTAAAESME